MCRVSLLQTLRKNQRITTAALTCLLLAGCLGQKSNLPTLGWNPSSKEKSAPPATPQPEVVPSSVGLAHVALNSPQNLGAAQELPRTEVVMASNETQPAPSTAQTMSEIDAAFRNLQTGVAPAGESTAANSLNEFGEVVSAVEQGESHLSALKASLEQINQTPQQTGSDLPANLAEQFAGQSTQPAPAAVNPAQEYPWGSQEVAAVESAAVATTDRVRLMLSKSLELVQQNNLIAARTVAESAQTMMQRTHAALSPGEVTPQQVLAEIKQRQQQHEQQLQMLAANTQSPPSAVTAPVVIDLSREQLNSRQSAAKRQPVNEIQKFAEATVVANRAASLPQATPPITEQLSAAPPLVVELDTRQQMLNNPQQTKSPAAHQERDPQVVLLGEMPAESAAQPFVLSLEPEGPASIVAVDNEAPVLGGSQAGMNSAPLLIAPGGETQLPAAEIDEFAADFANVSQGEAPEMVSAPLLIDESDLQLEPTPKPFLSTTMLTLIACIMAVGTVLFVRWRR